MPKNDNADGAKRPSVMRLANQTATAVIDSRILHRQYAASGEGVIGVPGAKKWLLQWVSPIAQKLPCREHIWTNLEPVDCSISIPLIKPRCYLIPMQRSCRGGMSSLNLMERQKERHGSGVKKILSALQPGHQEDNLITMQRGRLNLLTPERISGAAKLVKTGETVGLK